MTQSGRLMAAEGEMSVDTVNGVVYQLRFGEVAPAQGESKPSGNRYLFAMAVFDPARAAKYWLVMRRSARGRQRICRRGLPIGTT